jgi:hypothetical protein
MLPVPREGESGHKSLLVGGVFLKNVPRVGGCFSTFRPLKEA